MEFDLTPAHPVGGPYASPQYDEEDRNEIINLIRSLESSPVPQNQNQPIMNVHDDHQPLTPNSDSLFDDPSREITKYYAEDFDAMFSF
jgi:hypothetical protein